jgi:hypothetical protein
MSRNSNPAGNPILEPVGEASAVSVASTALQAVVSEPRYLDEGVASPSSASALIQPPSTAIVERQDSTHTEEKFMSDLGRATSNRAKERLAREN